jgi:hypothetical protein
MAIFSLFWDVLGESKDRSPKKELRSLNVDPLNDL